jgi:hypothetical protein
MQTNTPLLDKFNVPYLEDAVEGMVLSGFMEYEDGEDIDHLNSTIKALLRKGIPAEKLVEELKPFFRQQFNPYLDIKHEEGVTGNPRIWVQPYTSPRFKMEATVLGFKPIFHNHCSLVECQTNSGEHFVYFDPDFNQATYARALSQKRTLALTAVSKSRVLIDTDTDGPITDGFTPDALRQIKEKGFTNNQIENQAIFSNPEIEKRFKNYGAFNVQNPFDKRSKLELIATIGNDFPDRTPEGMGVHFYLIGSIK